MALGAITPRELVREYRAMEAAAQATGLSIDDVVSGLGDAAGAGINTISTAAESSPKLAKQGEHVHVLARVVYLLNTGRSCGARDKGCVGCYGYGGRGVMKGNLAARTAREDLYWNNRPAFMATLAVEIARLEQAARDAGMFPAFRLNGLSDILFELESVGECRNIFEAFPGVQFWDYTRIPGRVSRLDKMPANYDLTFSLGADNDRIAARALAHGWRLSVVMRGEWQDVWAGLPVVNGDTHDYRFVESPGVIVRLTAKGRARKDITGFVRNPGEGLDLSRVPMFGRGVEFSR